MNPQDLYVFKKAKSSLEANILDSPAGRILVAGPNQFCTLWVRDFCYSVRGLLALDHTDVVRNSLFLILSSIRSDGVCPRGLDEINPKWRVLRATLKMIFQADRTARSELPRPSPYRRFIRPEYLGEHKTPAMDSNLLVMLASLDYLQACPEDRMFEALFESKQELLLKYYVSFKKNGLVYQLPFSDWQDSARREGPTLYLNTLYLKTLKRLSNRPEFVSEVGIFSETIFKNLIFSGDDFRDDVTLEALLFIIEEDLLAPHISANELYQKLKRSKLWENPGRPRLANYPIQEISWTTRLVGLRHYHDEFRWSWLWGEALKIAKIMNDDFEVKRIETLIFQAFEQHESVHEIYQPNDLKPVRRKLYAAEAPFSWGAAKIIEAVNL